jgi:hypothetical protein
VNNAPACSSPVDQPARTLPQPGAWVAQLGCDDYHPRIAKVRDAYPDHNALDLIFFSGTGERIGRVSPAMGGPKGFEPFCSAELWVEIDAPPFDEIAKTRWGWRDLLTPREG